MQVIMRPAMNSKTDGMYEDSDADTLSPPPSSPKPIPKASQSARSQLSSQDIQDAFSRQRLNYNRGSRSLAVPMQASTSKSSAPSASQGSRRSKTVSGKRKLGSLSQAESSQSKSRRGLKPDSAFKTDDDDDDSSSSEDDAARDCDYAEAKAKKAAAKLDRRKGKSAAKTSTPSLSAPVAQSSSTPDLKLKTKAKAPAGSWLDDLTPGPSRLASNSVPPDELQRAMSFNERVFDDLSRDEQRRGSGAYPTRAAGLARCPFCARRLPIDPSAALTTTLQELLDLAHSENRTLKIDEYSSACQRHTKEVTLASGASQGWPTSFDVKKLRKRVRSGTTCRLLEARMASPDKSDWFVEERRIRSKHGFYLDSIAGQLETLHEQQAGYYGEIGAHAIREELTQILITAPSKAELDLDALARRRGSPIEPMTPAQFLERVLFPEVVCTLLREDSGGAISFTEARNIRDKSNQYGILRFPLDPDNDEDDEDSDGDAAEDNAFVAVSGPFRQASTSALDDVIGRDSSPEVYEATGTSTRGSGRTAPSAREVIDVIDNSPRKTKKTNGKGPSQTASLGPISLSLNTATSQATQSRPRPRPRASGAAKASSSALPRASLDDEFPSLDLPSSSFPEPFGAEQPKKTPAVPACSSQDSLSSPHLSPAILESVAANSEARQPPPSSLAEHVSRKRAKS